MAIDISRFKTRRVLVVGDLVIDEFIRGTVENVSREAPVPVVSVNHEKYELGGAGNVARNLASLGAKVSVVGVTGAGSGSRILMDAFARHKIDTTGIHADKQRRTSRKTRIFSSCQQLLQVERESSVSLSSASESAMILAIREKIPQVDLVVVSDLGKGTLNRSLLTEVFSQARQRNIVSIVDPYGTHYEKYIGATILTPNIKELAIEAGIRVSDRTGLFKAGTELLKATRAEGLAVTCGKDGLVIFGRAVQPVYIETEERQVFDVTGARDTMVAVLGLALATGGSFMDAATVANVAAGLVVDRVGTACVTEKEIILELMAYSGHAAAPREEELFSKKQPLY
jgi:D-beta-D-heptose 7-phosphate kinase/D-beta-D-heptose 1-phosphate adenosyltransferase